LKFKACLNNYCRNGGKCLSYGKNYSCSCMNGYVVPNCLTLRLNSTIFKNSSILTNEQSVKLVKLIGLTSNWKLIYQASVDGFSTTSFHSKCDGYLGTLSVVKTSNQNVFGGFTVADWNGGYGIYKYDANAFVFSLINKYNVSAKMNVTNPANAIYASSSYSLYFGSDL